MTEPARPTRAEPNDRYDGPILPGQRWRSRGTSKHQFLLYTVLRFNGRSVKAVVEGHAHHGGKVYNIPEASWRGNYNLHKQAPDYDPARDYSADPQLDPIEEAITEVKVHQEAFVFGSSHLDGVPNAPMWPDEQRTPGTVKSVTDRTLDPPSRAGVLELLSAVERNIREEQQQKMNQTVPAPEPVVVRVPRPIPDPEPVVVAGEVVDYTVPLPGHENPLQGWIEQGQQLVQRLTNELASVEVKRRELGEQLVALNAQYDAIEVQRDQAEAAVRHAIGLAEGPAEPPEPLEPPARPRTPEGARFAPQPGKVTQKDWVLSRLEPGKHFRVAQVRDAFATEYGLTPDAATKNVSSLLGYQLKGRDKRYPAISRVESGVYYVLEPAPNASGV